MATQAQFAEIASLAGDPARAAMLHALMDGRALTASELAGVAGVTPQTASGHLARLSEAGLLAVEKQGRHRYYRLASAMVAQMVESLMQVASALAPTRRVATGPRDAALRTARTCYDHIAGRLGVALADGLVTAGHVDLASDGGLVTDQGLAFFSDLGIDLATETSGRRTTRVLCRPCLDWSERRPHLAGRVGAALCDLSLASGWIRKVDGSRALRVTRKGEAAFRDRFGLALDTE
ncbi:ArsR/SmtB family transcription factor [Amorphus sp. 3PC139-8]|uniref:ArsR/SmtB family transcription factor n=1 Tax=Amorphus sp. 3PC139-8 TaxID=2735676 RepID=UPI00345DE4DF